MATSALFIISILWPKPIPSARTIIPAISKLEKSNLFHFFREKFQDGVSLFNE
jgi:hypothetical protein